MYMEMARHLSDIFLFCFFLISRFYNSSTILQTVLILKFKYNKFKMKETEDTHL